jgi:hypothetical protein
LFAIIVAGGSIFFGRGFSSTGAIGFVNALGVSNFAGAGLGCSIDFVD